jgi:hypothetical protein
VRYVRILLAAASLAACGEPPLNSTSQVEIRVVNSTGLSDVAVTVSWVEEDGGARQHTPSSHRMTVSTGFLAAGQPLQFHVEVGNETTDHTCHVHADAIGNPDNVPTAVIYRDPLRNSVPERVAGGRSGVSPAGRLLVSYYYGCPLSVACFMVSIGIASWPFFTVVSTSTFTVVSLEMIVVSWVCLGVITVSFACPTRSFSPARPQPATPTKTSAPANTSRMSVLRVTAPALCRGRPGPAWATQSNPVPGKPECGD